MPQRAPHQREIDLASIARWYAEHVPQTEIARRLGITQPMVNKELKWLRAEWQRDTAEDFAEAMATQIRALKHVQAKAWAGWRRSRRPAQRQTSRKRDRTPRGGGAAVTEVATTLVKECRPGHPRFLLIVLNALDQIARLRGLYRLARAENDPAGAAAAGVKLVIVRPDNERGDGPAPATAAAAVAESGSADIARAACGDRLA